MKENKVRPMDHGNVNEINELGYYDAHPQASLRDAERELGISKTSIQRILKNIDLDHILTQI